MTSVIFLVKLTIQSDAKANNKLKKMYIFVCEFIPNIKQYTYIR